MSATKKVGALGRRSVTKTGTKAKPARMPKTSSNGGGRKGGSNGGRKGSGGAR